MTDRPLLSCRQVLEFLADYVGRSLSESEREEFDRHLIRCASCRAYLASYETTITLARAALRSEEAIVQDAPEELIEAVLAVTSKQ